MKIGKTFVLGLGAQKSGTTWLHSYLSSFSEADFGLIKEYHIWDKEVFPSYLVNEHDLLASRDKKKILDLRVRYAFQKLEGVYEAYFSGLIVPGRVRLTGDISPGYSALSAETLMEIQRRLESRNFDIKIVFLMRDPVERIWSAARMGRRNRIKQGENPNGFVSEVKELCELYKTRQFELRSRYDRTISEIEKVFPLDSIYYGFYENLFSEEKITELSSFFGLIPNLEYASVKVNVSQKNNDLPEDVAQEIARHYKSVYEYCFDRFPITKKIWNVY